MKFILNSAGQCRQILHGVVYTITRLSAKDFDATIISTDGRQFNKQVDSLEQAAGYCNDIRRQLNNQ